MARGRPGRTGLGLRLLVLWWVSVADQSHPSGSYGQPTPSPGWFVHACPNSACEEPTRLRSGSAGTIPVCACETTMVTRTILSGMNLKALPIGQIIWVCVRCETKPVRTGATAPLCACGHLMKRFSK